MDTVFEGEITIILPDKQKRPVTTINIYDLGTILKPEYGFKPLEGGKPGSVVFTNEGALSCTYGTEQRIELKEEEL